MRQHGLIQSVTHPDPGYLGDRDKRARYVELLDVLRSRQEIWHALPRDVARWWRARDTGLPTDWPSGLGRASLADGRVSLVESQSS